MIYDPTGSIGRMKARNERARRAREALRKANEQVIALKKAGKMRKNSDDWKRDYKKEFSSSKTTLFR
jgi:hypothetical protein